ncbi:MAG: hypothetical protein U9R72_14685 [Chloroflexota bacterium]|nr:hypothetical protein [Chloroflexota bacterium]
MDEPIPGAQRTPEPRSPKSREELILSIAGGAILLFAAVAIIVFLGLRGSGEGNADEPPSTDEVEMTSTSPSSPLPTPSCETLIRSGNVEVSIAHPVSATIKDAQFAVETIVPQQDAWNYPADRSDVAVWVCGTVVNYAIALEPTPENEGLMTSLTPGERIRLQLANGTVLPFRFVGRQEVSAGDEGVLAQRQPGLTLILAEGDVWQVATADYVAEEDPAQAVSSEPSAQLGQPVRAGDARVTVREGHAERADGLPAGTMYYLVEFSMENVGDVPLPTGLFSMRLRDALGNTYLVSPSASEAGDHGPLSGEIDPGASADATAGYLVPDPLSAGPLTWSFSPRPGSAGEVTIGISHESVMGTAVAQVEVTVDDAFLDDELLIVVGKVRNGRGEPLTVETADVTLSSSGGTSELIAAAPPLPWSIEPGEEQVIELQYQRPGTDSALLELLGYSFEIAGLE